MIRKSKIKNRKSKMGFTIMELMVSISILILIIGAVGVVFSGASNSVGTSQALMEQMAAVRAIQSQIDRDLHALDRSGFLVIRSQLQNPNFSPLPNGSGLRYIDVTQHYDQFSFLASGTFPNPTGCDQANPFTDNSVASSAHIWWGQLIMERSGASSNISQAPYPSFVPPDQSAFYLNYPPTGVYKNGGNLVITKESDFMLGRHLTLLVPGPADGQGHVYPAGNPVVAYPNLDGTSNYLASSLMESSNKAHITSARYGVVAQSAAQVMQNIAAARGTSTGLGPEALACTYRFRALASIYDTEVNQEPFVNGYFRLTPQALASVSSFRVEWSNGDVYNHNVNPNDPPALNGQLKWFGASYPNTTMPAGTEVYNNDGSALPTGDNYIATFSYYNKNAWPKALRITMHIASDRLGGRDFTQIVNLPQ